jgi:hypothetical protein
MDLLAQVWDGSMWGVKPWAISPDPTHGGRGVAKHLIMMLGGALITNLPHQLWLL